MRRLPSLIAAVVAVALCAVGAAGAATYKGRNVDDHWFQGRVVNNDFGAYDVQVRFREDRAQVKFVQYNFQMEGFLEEEVISDPHRITVYDPLHGVYWTLDVFNFGG